MRRVTKKLLWFGLAWLIPSLLMVSAVYPEYQYGARYLTVEKMKILRQRAERYLAKFPATYPSLREISEYYSTRTYQPSGIYDHYGMRFDLRSLDDAYIMVKSWAPIMFADPDHQFAQKLYAASPRWPKLFPVVIHSYPEPPVLYQPAHLISSTSFDQSLTARLFVNHKTAHRTLVVVRSDNYDPVFIHDTFQPEEFFWLPGRRILVFTSDPEHSSKGPLHFYDADHDEVRTITMEESVLEDHKQVSTVKPYIAALAGAQKEYLYAYMMPYHNKPLHPSELFAVDHLYKIQITFPRGSHARFQTHMALVQPNDLETFELKSEYFKPKLGLGNVTQRMWFRLKVTGNIENNIDHWQRFALRAHDRHSPMLPYALMTLISLYDRMSHFYALHNKAQGVQLHQFAVGYAHLVAKGKSYPTWLNLVAWDVWNRLQYDQEINLSVITPLSQSTPQNTSKSTPQSRP